MMHVLALRTYWGKLMRLSMSSTQLIQLRTHLEAGSMDTISLGGYVFRILHDVIYFANSGIPSKYYFDMSPQEVIAVIDETLKHK